MYRLSIKQENKNPRYNLIFWMKVIAILFQLW